MTRDDSQSCQLHGITVFYRMHCLERFNLRCQQVIAEAFIYPYPVTGLYRPIGTVGSCIHIS